LIISSNNLYAANFEHADSLFRLKLYPEACIAYEYIIFENPGNETIKALALLKKSSCYKAENNYALIDNMLNRCNVSDLNDSIKAQIFFARAWACYMNGNFEFAKDRILPIFNINTSPEIEKASVLLYSLILNEMGKWDESKNNLVSYINRIDIKDMNMRDSLLQEVNVIYQKNNIPTLKNIKTARTMSFILPGLGQTYAGKAGMGIISLSLIALSGTFIYYSIIDQIYASSAAGLYVFLYFYSGNITKLKPMVDNRNERKKEICNAALRIQLIKLNSQLIIQ
jgi:TM2 domain-containing membrane protein YozV